MYCRSCCIPRWRWWGRIFQVIGFLCFLCISLFFIGLCFKCQCTFDFWQGTFRWYWFKGGILLFSFSFKGKRAFFFSTYDHALVMDLNLIFFFNNSVKFGIAANDVWETWKIPTHASESCCKSSAGMTLSNGVTNCVIMKTDSLRIRYSLCSVLKVHFQKKRG